jgi:Ca-activated chloride channel family protein
MIHFLWPWLFLLLPLPLLARRWLPPAPHPGGALRLPFRLEPPSTGGPHPRHIAPRLLPAWLIWLLLLTAAARPQWLDPSAPLRTTGRDLMLAVDISGSMRNQDFDLAGQRVNRLEAVQELAGRFIERRRGDRIGLILFGSQAFLQSPLSHDRATVHTLLNEAEIGLAGEFTAIGDAIGLAVQRLRGPHVASRVLVLLTDGAHTTGRVGPLEAARLAAREGIRIYTIGVGPRPGEQTGTASEDLDEDTLAAVAEITGGHYFHAGDSEALEWVYGRLDTLEPTPGDDLHRYQASPLYPWPLAGALLLSVLLAVRRGAGGLQRPRSGGKQAG